MKRRRMGFLLALAGSAAALCFSDSSITQASTLARQIRNPLVGGIQLGTPTQDLKAKYPSLYIHSLPGGEILYEACNQRMLHVFTFVEQPWTRGRIGEVSVRRADVHTCKDENGQLPDLSLPAITDRHVALGNGEKAILSAYGPPDEQAGVGPGKKRLRYRILSERSGEGVGHLVFMLTGGRIISISASYDPPNE